jgi:glyoxylase-like metal-dependent hydrolase (beta-lactamase superfamily II)
MKLICDSVYRFEDQYFYGEKVGVYLIELEDKVLLFDLPTYSKEIENFIKSFSKPVIALLSHGPCGIASGTIWQARLGLKVYLNKADKESIWMKMTPDYLFEEIPTLDDQIEIVSTPGHSKGSVSLYHKPSKSLFTGDLFGGLPNGKVRDFVKEDSRNDDVDERLESCRKLLDIDFERVLPFHYEMMFKDAKKELLTLVAKYI